MGACTCLSRTGKSTHMPCRVTSSNLHDSGAACNRQWDCFTRSSLQILAFLINQKQERKCKLQHQPTNLAPRCIFSFNMTTAFLTQMICIEVTVKTEHAGGGAASRGLSCSPLQKPSLNHMRKQAGSNQKATEGRSLPPYNAW